VQFLSQGFIIRLVVFALAPILSLNLSLLFSPQMSGYVNTIAKAIFTIFFVYGILLLSHMWIGVCYNYCETDTIRKPNGRS